MNRREAWQHVRYAVLARSVGLCRGCWAAIAAGERFDVLRVDSNDHAAFHRRCRLRFDAKSRCARAAATRRARRAQLALPFTSARAA